MNENAPKISVIIPVYNTEKYLRECLDSALGQTFKDIEVICVNDGSTDGSSQILEEYTAKDSRIFLIHQKNLGVSVARNVGLELARAEYILFLDSDDCFRPELCQKVYDKATEDNLDLVVFNLHVFLEKNCTSLSGGKTKRVLEKVSSDARLDLLSKTHTGPVGKLIKTSFLKEHDIQFPLGIIISEDEMVHWKVCCLAPRFGYVHEYLYFYRIHQDSALRQKKKYHSFEQLFPVVDMIESFLRTENIYHKYGPYFNYRKHNIYYSFFQRLGTKSDRNAAILLMKKLLDDTNRAFFKDSYRDFKKDRSQLIDHILAIFYKSIDGSLLHSFLYSSFSAANYCRKKMKCFVDIFR